MQCATTAEGCQHQPTAPPKTDTDNPQQIAYSTLRYDMAGDNRIVWR